MSHSNENIPRLDDEEVRTIRERLRRSASLRQSFAPEGPLTIVIDGEARGSLNPNRQRRFRQEIGDESEWVEIHDRTGGGDLLLAAHLCRRDEATPKRRKRKYSTILEGGQKINFVTYSEGEKSFIEISYRETNVFKALPLFWRLLKNKLISLAPLVSGGPRFMLALVSGATARRLAYFLVPTCLLVTFAVWYNARQTNNAKGDQPRGWISVLHTQLEGEIVALQPPLAYPERFPPETSTSDGSPAKKPNRPGRGLRASSSQTRRVISPSADLLTHVAGYQPSNHQTSEAVSNSAYLRSNEITRHTVCLPPP